MKIGTILAFAIGLAGPYTTAAPSSALDGIVVKRHLNGFRTELHPVARLTSRASPIIINAPGVTDETQSVVSVYACSRRNFAGFCVFVRSFPDQCVQPPPTAPNANDTTSSVVPEGPFKCRFYTRDACSELGGYLDVQYPGYLDLNQINFDNVISSYKCSLLQTQI